MNLTKYIDQLKRFDWLLFGATVILVFIGLIAIYTVNLGTGSGDLLNFKKQIVFFIIGFIGLLYLSLVDYRIYRNYSRLLYILGIVILILLLIFGKTIRGTKGWFVFGPMTWQPVEVIKVLMVIFLAYLFSLWGRQFVYFKYVLITAISTFVYFFWLRCNLILVQL